jgi:uncharacterized protein YjbI with pentapeptide repeats
MANEEHLAKLNEGREPWNEWRKENPDVIPDLSDASFVQADFSGYHLDRVQFVSAELVNANFSKVDLSDANFDDSDARGAIFTNAELWNTNYADARLKNADFGDAELSFTNFSRTSVFGANFTNATMRYCVLTARSLAGTIGLETIRHRGPSSVGIDTLFASGGLPESFLRGCGVPEEFVQYAGALIGKPIEYYSCFISYSSADEEFARRLYADLQSRSIRTWFAPEDLKIGERFRSSIDESIRVHDKLVLILSASSIDSTWVEKEVETAFARERKENRNDVLFPIRVDDTVFTTGRAWAADIVNTRHIGDFRNWKSHDDYTKVLDRLIRDLKKSQLPVVMK